MRVQPPRVLLVSLCLAFGFSLLSPSAEASSKKKSWPSKKHHKTHHKAGKPSSKSTTTGGTAAPAEEPDDDEGGESAEDDGKQDDAKAKPKAKGQPADDGAREASDDRSHGEDEGDGDSSVVRRKAKRPVMEDSGAPIALELAAGPRAIHRNFDFHSPLSSFNPAAAKPYAYVLPAGPAPFVDLALYPAAFATRGVLANFGLVARYEKLLGTKTQAPDGSSFNTLGQQLEVGLRGRLPVGESELGLTGSYGKHTFHVAENDPGPGAGSTVPNVDYTFAGVDADARLRLSSVELGAHVGSRIVFDTGALGKTWFSTVKTNSIEAGLSVSYRVTPLIGVVGGVDFLRYGFNFNPVSMNNAIVAGGAVDQYLSGFLALRLTLSGG